MQKSEKYRLIKPEILSTNESEVSVEDFVERWKRDPEAQALYLPNYILQGGTRMKILSLNLPGEELIDTQTVHVRILQLGLVPARRVDAEYFCKHFESPIDRRVVFLGTKEGPWEPNGYSPGSPTVSHHDEQQYIYGQSVHSNWSRNKFYFAALLIETMFPQSPVLWYRNAENGNFSLVT